MQLRDAGYTILISTHDLDSITTFCDQVVLINRTILAYGETSEVFTEENISRTFGGSVSESVVRGKFSHHQVLKDKGVSNGIS